MPDLRSNTQKKIDAALGMPLYYCSECLRMCRVTAGDPPKIHRPCTDCKDAGIIAPRRAVAVGRGGASMKVKTKIAWLKILSALTQRTMGSKHGGV